jgi:hypothetical protein
MKKDEIDLPANVGDLMTGHVVAMAAHHEVLADAHKAAAEDHTANAATHKAIHEHFKKAAEDGGEMAEHHGMHADAHKAISDHHTTKAEHHMGMHKAHSEMAAKCAKMAEDFADTPEKKTATATQLKAARDAKPVVKKSVLAPAVVDTSNMSKSEKDAFEAVNATWLNSDEYKQMTTDMLRKQTIAKLNAAGNSAAIAVGIEPGEGNIYAVPRAGQVAKGDDDGEALTGSVKLFDYMK